MDYQQQIRELLQKIGPGHMMNTVYDTAWMVRLGELGEPVGERALAWIRENQLPDGSWGAAQPRYFHDRVICTLAAINALARRGRVQDRVRLRRAESALAIATKGLDADPAGETVGFELIVPTLLNEAKALGAIHQEETGILKRLTPRRGAKLASLPQRMINRHVTVAFSVEMAGPDAKQLIDIENLQEDNGSVGHSPSATAYFALYLRRRDPQALQYLKTVIQNGAAPNVAPFDIFERAWALWHLSRTESLDEELLALCEPHLDFLENAWNSKQGVGFAAGYTPKDSDDTGLVYEVLGRFGRTMDLDAILHYEESQHFRCYALESNPSISANIHVLGALRQAGLDKQHPSVQKVMRFLVRSRTADMLWFDKWHSSPYYATTHAIMVCVGLNDLIVQDAIDWILGTQNEDGSWGYYTPTAEETAYCLKALTIWRQQGHYVAEVVLKRGADWLCQNMEPPYPPLWIGKCLYCPEYVVRSAILSAIIMVEASVT